MFLSYIKSEFNSQYNLASIFFRYAFRESFIAILFRAAAEFAQVLSLLLPLKIFIIMGSEGIPVYLNSLISNESKTTWLIILSIITIFIYLLAIMLNVISGWIMGKGISKLLPAPHVFKTSSKNDRLNLVKVYKLSLELYANLLIVILGLLLIFALNPLIFVLIFSFLMLQVLIVNFVLGSKLGLFKRLTQSIFRNKTECIKYFSAMNFLGLFIFLFVSFMIGNQFNVLIGILLLLLGRRIFQSFQKAGTNLIKLREECPDVRVVINDIFTKIA